MWMMSDLSIIGEKKYNSQTSMTTDKSESHHSQLQKKIKMRQESTDSTTPLNLDDIQAQMKKITKRSRSIEMQNSYQFYSSNNDEFEDVDKDHGATKSLRYNKEKEIPAVVLAANKKDQSLKIHTAKTEEQEGDNYSHLIENLPSPKESDTFLIKHDAEDLSLHSLEHSEVLDQKEYEGELYENESNSGEGDENTPKKQLEDIRYLAGEINPNSPISKVHVNFFKKEI